MLFLKNTAAKLSKKKSDILGSFNKTLGDLKNLQVEQEAHAQDLAAQQEKLTSERTQLNQVTSETNRAINKIEEFLA